MEGCRGHYHLQTMPFLRAPPFTTACSAGRFGAVSAVLPGSTCDTTAISLVGLLHLGHHLDYTALEFYLTISAWVFWGTPDTCDSGSTCLPRLPVWFLPFYRWVGCITTWVDSGLPPTWVPTTSTSRFTIGEENGPAVSGLPVLPHYSAL